MQHPFLKLNTFFLYLFIWVLVSGLFASALFFQFNFAWKPALIDSGIFHAIFGGLGLAYWFNVRYTSSDKSQWFNVLISHMAAAAISVGIGILLFQWLILFFNTDAPYRSFLKDTLSLRITLGVLYYAIVVLVYYVILYYHDARTRVQQQAELQAMLKGAELEMLKSQINPHFIFNSLNSIASLTLASPEKAHDMVVKLSHFLRHSLGKKSEQMNSLKEELSNILLYLDIEKVRFGDRLHVKTTVSKACETMMLPNLILQPIMENAIKHGIYENTEPVTIALSAKQKQNLLHITISNEYDPMATGRKGGGIGLKNVRERLHLIYGMSDWLQVSKNPERFTVTLDIPQLPKE